MRVSWICAGGLLLAVVFATQATSSHYAAERCDCNGHARFCLRDALGLRCLNCRDATEGRRCQRCSPGFHQQGAPRRCTPCGCSPAGSVGPECDSRGRCSCKDGVVGEKCDRCPNGPLGPDGCSHSRQTREDSGSLPCFCYGHSNQCSPQDGFSIHTITSTFSSGPEGWRAATMQGVTPPDVTFRWSPKHQDLEVISKQDLPIYLHAPERFLGDQLLSFGQNFSFSLRLDRGVRRPSTSDLVLEGAGLRAAASLGDLRAILPCGQKIRYSFRLDPGSGWRPQLSSFQFQTLLQNLTDIRIRATFGETGRGYLDDVALVSARPGSGSGSGSDPARWVWACRCPPGLAGRFCQRCAAGFCRVDPVSGAFSACSPDHCDPADQNHRTCPPGTAGPRCDVCEDGFYRQGLQDACTACGCAPRGSESVRCDGGGRCRCRPGYEGRRCDRAGCPACFSPVRTKMGDYAAKLKALEARLVADGDWSPDTPDGDWALKLMEELVDYLRDTADDLTDTESGLQGWLSSISRRQLLGGGLVQNLTLRTLDLQRQRRGFVATATGLKTLLEEMGGRLALAKTRLQSVDVAPRDPPTDPGDLAPLAETASSLADKHQKMADGVDAAAGGALQDAQDGLSLMRTLQNRENKVQELIGDLKALYESSGAEAQSLDRRAVRLGEEAGAESKMAADMLKEIARLEKNLPESMKDWGEAVRARLDPLRDSVDGEVSDLQELQTTVKGDQQDAQDLLDQGKAAQQEFTGLLDRVQEAKEETERALKTISDNRQDLDQTLRDLRGFEEQVSAGRAEADQAVSRLPGVQTSIRQAENRNQQTGQVLRDLQPEASGAMGAIGLLQEQLDLLQVVAPPPGGGGLAADGARLGAAVQDLRARSERTGGGAAAALEDARQEGAGAAEAAVAAAEALSSAKNSRDAVARTLREVHALLASTNKTGQVDPARLGALEALVSSQQQEVSGLGPRLLKVQVLEADRIRDLDRLDRDLDQVLADIQNLEEVLRAVPEGCYNSPPIEEA